MVDRETENILRERGVDIIALQRKVRHLEQENFIYRGMLKHLAIFIKETWLNMPDELRELEQSKRLIETMANIENHLELMENFPGSPLPTSTHSQ